MSDNKSDTPETDTASQAEIGMSSIAKGWYVHADFARKLERQRNAAYTAELDLLAKLHAKFGYVPHPDGSGKCYCAYCRRDAEALADHAAGLVAERDAWKSIATEAIALIKTLRPKVTEEGSLEDIQDCKIDDFLDKTKQLRINEP